MAKLVYCDPSYLIFLSDQNQIAGLPSSYENFAASPLPSKVLLKQLRSEIDLLPKRQKQVIKLFLKGKTDKEIAAKLKLKYQNVWTHRKKAIEKLRKKLCNFVHS